MECSRSLHVLYVYCMPASRSQAVCVLLVEHNLCSNHCVNEISTALLVHSVWVSPLVLNTGRAHRRLAGSRCTKHTV